MRTTVIVRALYGAVLLIAPDRILRTVIDEPTGREATVVRVLGARHLLQALTVERSERHGWLLVGIALDIAHALSMVAVAVLDANHRRLAVLDVVVACGWVLNGLRAVRRG